MCQGTLLLFLFCFLFCGGSRWKKTGGKDLFLENGNKNTMETPIANIREVPKNGDEYKTCLKPARRFACKRPKWDSGEKNGWETIQQPAVQQYINSQGWDACFFFLLLKWGSLREWFWTCTLHGTNISHQRKRKLIFPTTLGCDMLVSGNTFPVTESISTLDVSSLNDALHLGNPPCKSPLEVVS